MEESLTMNELFRVIKGINKKESDDRRFAAALKGIKLGGDDEGSGEMVDIMNHPIAKKLREESERNTDLDFMSESGQVEFGIGFGLGFSEE